MKKKFLKTLLVTAVMGAMFSFHAYAGETMVSRERESMQNSRREKVSEKIWEEAISSVIFLPRR